MTVKQLKQKLAELKLPTKGNKAALTARLKGATAKPSTKKEKPISHTVTQIRQACSALIETFGKELEGVMTFKLYPNNDGSFVLRLPRQKEAIKRLPESPEAKEALGTLSWLGNAVSEAFGDNKQTWCIHASGAACVHSTFVK